MKQELVCEDMCENGEFHDRMRNLVLVHGAINNKFLTRFAQGNITEPELRRFAVEFFHFSREWPAILATLLVNTPDEQEHEDSIGKALGIHAQNAAIHDSFQAGAEAVLNLLEAFWIGIEDG